MDAFHKKSEGALRMHGAQPVDDHGDTACAAYSAVGTGAYNMN
jgi:hypothetical protein